MDSPTEKVNDDFTHMWKEFLTPAVFYLEEPGKAGTPLKISLHARTGWLAVLSPVGDEMGKDYTVSEGERATAAARVLGLG